MRRTEDGGVFLLGRHLDRLSRSAAYFSFSCDVGEIRKTVIDTGGPHESPSRLRLLLARSGVFELESSALPSENPRELRLARFRVDSTDPFLYHKTTRREVYEREPDVVLVNERDEITETAIANVAVFRGGKWVTPAASCGLLPGVMRAELLARDEIVEDVIHSKELAAGETIRCFSALRGVFDVRMAS